MSKSRLESFSDGVIAVAITLLVLNIAVPKPVTGHTLAHDLLHQWPLYVAYTTSFVTIGIVWINHHAVICRLARADHAVLLLNLLLLLCVCAVPFATSVMTTYLRNPHGQRVAAGGYAATFLILTIVFVLLNWHILFRKAHMLHSQLSLGERRTIVSRGVTGIAPYAIATAVAALSPYATLAICAAIALFYAHPVATGAAWRPGGPRTDPTVHGRGLPQHPGEPGHVLQAGEGQGVAVGQGRPPGTGARRPMPPL